MGHCKESSFTSNTFHKNYFSFYNTSHGLDELLIDIFRTIEVNSVTLQWMVFSGLIQINCSDIFNLTDIFSRIIFVQALFCTLAMVDQIP